MVLPKIISIGYAVPEHTYSQHQIFNEFGYPSLFRKIFMESGIERRYFWVPLYSVKRLSFQQQQEFYKSGAISLSCDAVVDCLEGRPVDDIGCVVFSSCTGFSPGPTIPHYLSKVLGFGPRTYIRNLGSHGCEGGFPGIRTAMEYTTLTGKPSLVVACELSSCAYFPEPEEKPDPENDYELLRSNAIFADAAAAILVGYDDDPRHPYIIDTETYTNTEYIDELGFVWRDGRLRVRLSRKVPKIAASVVKPSVMAVLERNQLSVSDINWWVIHAAGVTVLNNVRDILGIDEEKMGLTRETLRLYGNTSSTSVGITGKRLMSQAIKAGDYVAMLSVGPGLTGGCTLLRFP